MSWPQLVTGVLMVALLLGVSGFYCWRQWQTLWRLDRSPALPEEERRRLVRQAYRRLAGCGLMLALAILLGGALLFLEGPAQRLADERAAGLAAGVLVELTAEQQAFRRFYAAYWIVFLLTLLALVCLAGFDLWATRRYGLREHRKIQADRRAMLRRQLTRLREERNGHP